MGIRTPLWVSVIFALVTPSPSAPPTRDAADLLARASAAFERNRLQEIHWNWVSKEKRAITDHAGKVEQLLPDVTIESVIRKDGKRCTAVLAWGDGVQAYLVNADPDSRCQATDEKDAMEISALLKSRRAKLVSEFAAGINLSITPDKDGLRSTVLEERCAASIRATVLLDAATFFPRRVDGEVVEDGCDLAHTTNVYYDGPVRQEAVRSSVHKGTSFRVEYELQKDKFQAPERNFWIAVRRHENILRWIQGGNFISWGRRFTITPRGAPQHIVVDIETAAQEFGAQSTISMRDGDKSYPGATTIATLPPIATPAVVSAPVPTTSAKTAGAPMADKATADVSIADKVAWLTRNSVTIRSIDPRDQDFADLRPLAQSIGDARIVLLGGSREDAAVNAKDRLVRFLHQEMGFDILASDANLLAAEELDGAMDRGAAPPADLKDAIALTLASQGPVAPHGPAASPLWAVPEAGIDANPPRVSPPPVVPVVPMQIAPSSDILDYARATHKTGSPLHVAGFGALLGNTVSTFTATDYPKRLIQFVNRIAPHLALPKDRKMIESLLMLSGLPPRNPAWSQPEEAWKSAQEVIARLYEGLGRVSPNSPDAREADFYRHTLANLEYSTFTMARRPLQERPMDSLVWIAKVWRPESKIVVWSSNGMAVRNLPVCRELGTTVYTIALSEIKDDNGVLEVLAAGPQPSLLPVEGDLESLLHAAGKPYSFVDFRGLPQDHWLRQPLAARSIRVTVSGIASLPKFYDGLLSIDLAVLKDKK
jgi:hypothetical protein